jgi:hypothetical protein
MFRAHPSVVRRKELGVIDKVIHDCREVILIVSLRTLT